MIRTPELLALLTDARRGEMVVDFCAGAGLAAVATFLPPSASRALTSGF